MASNALTAPAGSDGPTRAQKLWSNAWGLMKEVAGPFFAFGFLLYVPIMCTVESGVLTAMYHVYYDLLSILKNEDVTLMLVDEAS